VNRAVQIDLPGAVLSGDLTIPEEASGLVIFAHGSGSSRHSPRNRFVAQRINAQGLGTLLVDLLTAEEEEADEVTREMRFDIGLLVRTVVSRGGRPDLAREALARVQCPVLLIVGGQDDVVIDLSKQARAEMRCETELVIVPGATHLFEEEGALEEVADLAAEWLGERLGKGA
jgi:putative phosphoribosyl transferase